MKNNIAIKIIFIMIIVLITLFNFCNITYSTDVINNIITNKDKYFKPEVKEEKLSERAGVILGLVNVIGVLISVITLMIVGIKYMVGSIEEKAEYKKTMWTYLLGAFLVFSITTIPNIIFNISSNI